MSNAQEFALRLPITQTIYNVAQEFARQQLTLEKAEQVYFNTIAVGIVHEYLQLLGISTDLNASDSWNPVMRLIHDLADLKVQDIGYLECRPIQVEQRSCWIPPESWEDRIGYVLVEIGESIQEARLLGFSPTVEEELSIDQLRSPETLVDHLNQLKGASVDARSPNLSSELIDLGRWLQGWLDAGWQSIESILNTEPNLVVSFRAALSSADSELMQMDVGTRRAKLVNLEVQVGQETVVLVIALRPERDQRSNQTINIHLQLYPTGGQRYLPPNLQLLVLEEAGVTFLEAQSRQRDNYIQLRLSGSSGERFSIQVQLGNSSVVEHFII